MPKNYTVTLPIAGHAFVEVEADTAEEAIEKAMKAVTLRDIEEWEALSKVNSGNVCHFPTPWQAEAVED